VLNGKITVHSKYYQDSVEELRKIFTKLNLILIGGPALRFADPEVFRVLLEATVGIDKSSRMVDYDNDGMLTEEELAAVTTLSHRRDDVYSMFVEGYNLGNELIETFDEFRYFTGLTSINGSAFTWCKSLRRISLPPNIVEIKSSAFGATAIEKLVINEGCKICGNGFISLNKKCKLIDFPSTIISIGLRPTNNGGDKLVVICRALVPPVFEGAWSYVEAGRPIAIYVPDASMLAYKSATGWSESANLIQALSTYEEQ
ncbi:leucine-rich repeat protein, partial [Bacteroides cellulosilyticus]